MNVVNIALIGVGYWGPNILRNLLTCSNINVSVVCDLKNSNLQKVKKTHPFIHTTQDIQEILQNKSIHAVIIATPVSTHFDIAKLVIKAKKHVLIEKPMTQTSTQARELILLSKKNNVIVMAGHTFVYTEAVKKIKELIDKKELGEIYYFDSTRINLGLLQQDTNVIWDLAPHDLSILAHIFRQKPLSIQAFASSHVNKRVEEMAHIFIEYGKNMSAHIHVSWLSPVKIRTILVGGRKKMIVFNDIEPSEKVRLYDKNVSLPKSKVTPFAPAYRGGSVIIPHLEQKEALKNELEHFADCIIKNKKPITDAVTGLRTVRLLELIEKALKTKTAVKVTGYA